MSGPHALSAHLDEASVRLTSGCRRYGIAAALTTADRRQEIEDALRGLLLPRGRPYLHHYDEPPRRRATIAETLAEVPLAGAIILAENTSDRGQERARARLMTELLPRLQHLEHVENVVIESRQAGDAHDVRVRDQLRRSHRITAALRIDHLSKQAGDPLVWLSDFIMGAYLAAHHHDEPGPWKTLTETHLIDVVCRE